MSQPLPYEQTHDEIEAIKTVREIFEHNSYVAPELIVMEVAQRGYAVDPAWLVKVIDRERQREGHIPIILAVFYPTRTIKCSDCYAVDRTITHADFIVLIDVSSVWKAVCGSCCDNYEWNDETELELTFTLE
jgi:hypothetical protein